jgi:hypothetical protein
MTNDVRAPRDFAETQFDHTPDLPVSAVFGPHFGQAHPELRVVASKLDTHAPAPATHAGYPDPEKLMREREQRTRIERAAERAHHQMVFGGAQRQADAINVARKEAYERGDRHGYTDGYWIGMLLGGFLGSVLTYIAVRIGFALAS